MSLIIYCTWDLLKITKVLCIYRSNHTKNRYNFLDYLINARHYAEHFTDVTLILTRTLQNKFTNKEAEAQAIYSQCYTKYKFCWIVFLHSRRLHIYCITTLTPGPKCEGPSKGLHTWEGALRFTTRKKNTTSVVSSLETERLILILKQLSSSG